MSPFLLSTPAIWPRLTKVMLQVTTQYSLIAGRHAAQRCKGVCCVQMQSARCVGYCCRSIKRLLPMCLHRKQHCQCCALALSLAAVQNNIQQRISTAPGLQHQPGVCCTCSVPAIPFEVSGVSP
jgi:hypothetical protein